MVGLEALVGMCALTGRVQSPSVMGSGEVQALA